MWRRWPAKTLSELLLITFNTQQVVWNNIHFVMWDLGGQESLRTAWNTYYSNTEFIILVMAIGYIYNHLYTHLKQLFLWRWLTVQTGREYLCQKRSCTECWRATSSTRRRFLFLPISKMSPAAWLPPRSRNSSAYRHVLHLASSLTHAFQNLRKHQWQIQACCGLTGEGWVTKICIWIWPTPVFFQAVPGARVDC